MNGWNQLFHQLAKRRACAISLIASSSGTVRPYQPGGQIQEDQWKKKKGHNACDFTRWSRDGHLKPKTRFNVTTVFVKQCKQKIQIGALLQQPTQLSGTA